MKKIFLTAVMALMVLALNGCGSEETVSTPTYFSSILSDPVYDGDIIKPFIPGTNFVTPGMTPTVQSVFAGIDPVTIDEYRAFLHFPLTGANGVPGNAVIVSASLDIFIKSIQTQPLVGSIPIRIELVSFPQPMDGSDFDRPARVPTIISFPIFLTDLNRHVKIDVTPLMVEAQRLELDNFQIRIMENLGVVSPGLIEINDTTGPNRAIFAPLLEVTYF